MKRYTPLYLIFAFVCLFALLPTNALAKTVELNPIEKPTRDPRIAADYQLTISGSAQTPEVTVKVFQGEKLIYFDVVQPDDGTYKTELTLPSPIPNNTTFTIVAGLGQEVDSKTFKFYYKNDGGSSGSSDNETGGGGGTTPPKKPEEFSLRLLDYVPQDLADALSCKREVLAVYEVVPDTLELTKPTQLTFPLDEEQVGNKQVYLYYYSDVTDTWLTLEASREKAQLSVEQSKLYKKYALVVADLTPSYSDITGHWAMGDIEETGCLGLVNGYPDQTFRPDRSISRLEFSLILHRTLQLKGDAPALTFADTQLIPEWAQADIARAVQAGLIRGYNDNTFHPEQAISRSEIATMLVRALQANTNSSVTTNFLDDGEIPTWAKSSVAAAVELGLVNGRDGNLFAPNANTTRAEAVVLALRLLRTMD